MFTAERLWLVFDSIYHDFDKKIIVWLVAKISSWFKTRIFDWFKIGMAGKSAFCDFKIWVLAMYYRILENVQSSQN